MFTSLLNLFTNEIVRLALMPLGILTTGLGILAGSCLTVWAIYKTYLIMGGFVAESLIDFFKDFIFKGTIIIIASSASLWVTDIYKPLTETIDELALEMARGTKSSGNSIFSGIENSLTDIGKLMELSSTNKIEATDYVAEAEKENGEALGFFSWLWNSTKTKASSLAAASTNLSYLLGNLMNILKLLLVGAGILFIGIAAFICLLLNKVFFMISLGVGPIFLFFSAFEKTRGWFNSWLNSAIGYGFAYPLLSLAVGVVMEIYTRALKMPESLTFSIAFSLLGAGIVIAIIITRLGDLSSAFFGAGNIADGTALAIAAFGKGVTGKAASKASKAMDKGISATASVGIKGMRAGYKGVRNLFSGKTSLGDEKKNENA